MTAPVQTPGTPEVVQQRESVNRCLIALARSLDWPCECGGPSSACTKKADGSCD